MDHNSHDVERILDGLLRQISLPPPSAGFAERIIAQARPGAMRGGWRQEFADMFALSPRAAAFACMIVPVAGAMIGGNLGTEALWSFYEDGSVLIYLEEDLL